jgi:hypothetical protein
MMAAEGGVFLERLRPRRGLSRAPTARSREWLVARLALRAWRLGRASTAALWPAAARWTAVLAEPASAPPRTAVVPVVDLKRPSEELAARLEVAESAGSLADRRRRAGARFESVDGLVRAGWFARLAGPSAFGGFVGAAQAARRPFSAGRQLARRRLAARRRRGSRISWSGSSSAGTPSRPPAGSGQEPTLPPRGGRPGPWRTGRPFLSRRKSSRPTSSGVRPAPERFFLRLRGWPGGR